MALSRFTKNDCFAYHVSFGKNNEYKESCKALNFMECKKEGAVCPFYKSIIKEVDELRKYNNCTNVDQAISEYTIKKGKAATNEGDCEV